MAAYDNIFILYIVRKPYRGGSAPIHNERMTALETVCAIELRNITKRFGSVVANDGINLALNRGEILSLLGENAAVRPP